MGILHKAGGKVWQWKDSMTLPHDAMAQNSTSLKSALNSQLLSMGLKKFYAKDFILCYSIQVFLQQRIFGWLLFSY